MDFIWWSNSKNRWLSINNKPNLNKLIIILICIIIFISYLPIINGNIIENKNEIKTNHITSKELIIKFKNEISSHIFIYNILRKYNVLSFEKVFKNSNYKQFNNIFQIKLSTDSSIQNIIDKYTISPYIEYIESDDNGIFCSIPNDPLFNKQWALHNTGQYNGTIDADIDAPDAWDLEKGDSNIVIAILDTGIDYTHPDLKDNIWINNNEIADNGIDDDSNGFIDDIRGWDVHYNDNDPLDDVGHGTECAGIAAAKPDNNIGISGVCWNCKIMSVKVGNFTHVSRTNIARGIRYAVDNGANILSMSYGFNDPSFLERDALTYAYENGVVLVAAAGNAGSNKKFYPAAYSKVIAVGGTDMNDSNMHVFVDPPDFPGMWISSNHGLWVDVSAPAVNIYTTTPTYHVFFNDYGTEMNYTCATAGTSLSCPFVAGLVALILSKNPYLTPIEVKSVICNNSDPYVSDVYIGKGRINAYQAVTKQKEIDSKFTKEINLISRLNIDNNLSLLTEITIDFLPVKLSSNPSPALFYR